MVPKDLRATAEDGSSVHLRDLWNRRHSTKFNGVSYPVQRAAEAVYSDEGKAQIAEVIALYMSNARLIRETLVELGYKVAGGEHAPYVWVKTGTNSWDFFDRLLNDAGVVCTPGAGFGTCGEGHIRLSAFNSKENTETAMGRLRRVMA